MTTVITVQNDGAAPSQPAEFVSDNGASFEDVGAPSHQHGPVVATHVPPQTEVHNCHCDPPYAAKLRTVQKDGPNKGREFYVCPLSQNQNRCNYFRWKEEEKAGDSPARGQQGQAQAHKRPSTSATIDGMFEHAQSPSKKPRIDNSTAGASASAPNENAIKHVCGCGTVPPKVPFNDKTPHKCTTCHFFAWCNDPQCVPTAGAGSTADPNIVCHCKKTAELKLVKKEGANKGKKFYACPLPWGTANRCDFFKWESEIEKVKNDPFKPASVDAIDTFALTKQPHKLDTDGENAKRGVAAEKSFREAAIAQGFHCVATSEAADIVFHVDFTLSKGEFQDDLHRVDVKAAKKMARSDAGVQYKYVWVELHGVRPDDNGYLIDGWADWIAFELQEEFLIVDRRKMWKWLVTHMRHMIITDADGTEKNATEVFVDSPQDAIYKCYKRPKRHDKMTLVPVDDILQISDSVVAKWPRVDEIPDVIQYSSDDIFSATNAKGPIVICHVCNDEGKWGKGFVVAVSGNYTQPEEKYREWHASAVSGATSGADPTDETTFALGNVQIVDVTPDKAANAAGKVFVANIIGQHGIGLDEEGRAPIRYKAVRTALSKVAKFASAHQGCRVHMPRIGCGLAGGNWSFMAPIIREELCDHGLPVCVHDFE